MLIGLNLYEADAATMRRQTAACEALLALPTVEPLNLQFEDSVWQGDSRITTVPSLVRDSIQVTGAEGRRRPLSSDIFDLLASEALARGHQYFAYINSDIVVTPALVERVGQEPHDTYVVSRCDVDETGGARRMVTAGQDMFVVSAAWWQRERARFRPYIIGEACWDNVYTAIMMCHSNGIVLNREPLILHEQHPAIWRNEAPAARYNGFLAALDARYFSMWSQYWHRLDQLRTAEATAAEEMATAREVFVWRRSAPDALRQLVRNARAHRRFRRLKAEWIGAAAIG